MNSIIDAIIVIPADVRQQMIEALNDRIAQNDGMTVAEIQRVANEMIEAYVRDHPECVQVRR